MHSNSFKLQEVVVDIRDSMNDRSLYDDRGLGAHGISKLQGLGCVIIYSYIDQQIDLDLIFSDWDSLSTLSLTGADKASSVNQLYSLSSYNLNTTNGY